MGATSTTGIIACGALAADLKQLDAERGWGITVYPLPPLLHNHPDTIAGEVEATYGKHRTRHERWAIAYADCGTYGALDSVCERLGVQRLAGAHCYDVYAGQGQIAAELDQHPGTYFLTDFLVKGFHRTVIVELGLDRYPELREDYFGNYEQVVWLTGTATGPQADHLRELADQAASALGLPLVVRRVGLERLAQAVETLL